MIPSGYKQTEIGVIPEEWEIGTFKEWFDILSNNTLSRADMNNDHGTIKNIHYGDVLIKLGEVTNVKTASLPFVNDIQKVKSASRLRDGDIIIADTAEDYTVGKATEVCDSNDDTVISGLHTIPVRPKEGLFEKGFLGYFYNSSVYHNQLLPLITGTKVSAISKQGVSNTQILRPLHSEQKRIAEALSDVDGLISSLEKLIEKKKAVKQGAMQYMLTGKKRLPGFTGEWKDYIVGNIGDFYSGLSGKSKKDFDCGDARFITFLNVLSNVKIDTSLLASVDVKDNESQNAVKKGDLFFNTSSETPEEVGMCAVLDDEVENTYLNSFCFGYRLKDNKQNPLFLSYFFNGEIGRKIMSVLAQGATRYNLSKNNFAETMINLPSKEEQIAIASILSDMDSEIESLEKKLAKARQLKQGMMQQLLTGKIRLV